MTDQISTSDDGRRRGSVYRGMSLLASGGAASQVIGLARNVVLARLLSPEDYGMAAALLVALSFVQMATGTNVGLLIVRHPLGDEPQFQRSAHFFQLMRGFINAVTLYLLAPYLAAIFSRPDATWAFRAISIVPAIVGLQHLDARRLTRQLRFGPQVGIEVLSALAALTAATVAALWFGDYRAAVSSMIAQCVVSALVSQIAAVRTYRIEANRQYFREILEFGWPLILNGFVLFVLSSGDRLLIGAAQSILGPSAYTLADLGIYAAAATLATAPMLAISKVINGIGMPVLARASRANSVRVHYEKLIQITAFVGCAISVPTILLADEILELVYGTPYVEGAMVLRVLSTSHVIWAFRSTSNTLALSLGDSKTPLIVNMCRMVSLVVAFIGMFMGFGITAIAVGALLGELVGLSTSIARLRRVHAVAPAAAFSRLVAALAVITAAWGLSSLVGPADLLVQMTVAFTSVLAIALVAFIYDPDIHELIRVVIERGARLARPSC